MTKMNWHRANQRERSYGADDSNRALERAGTQFLAQNSGHKHKRHRKPPIKVALFLDDNSPADVWRVVGADCLWNTTPGKRQVWHNGHQVS